MGNLSEYSMAGSTQHSPRPPVSPIDAATATLADAVDFANRVRTIVDKLIGAVPEAAGEAKIEALHSGVITSLTYTAEETSSRIRQAQNSLDRLSTVLGL